MEREKEEMLCQRELAFIGKMLTTFVQKTPHHLVALQASAGRLAKLLEQANLKTEEDTKKLADLLSTVEKHLKIFSQKTEHLNRFAKRMSTLLSTFNPGEVVEEAVLFSTRLADMRKVSLRLELDETLPSLYSDPVCIHFLVSILINHMLERVGDGGKVIVSTGTSDKGLRISVTGHGILEPTGPSQPEAANRYWSIGQQMAADLGGHLQPAAIEHDTKQIFLFLPVETGLNYS